MFLFGGQNVRLVAALRVVDFRLRVTICIQVSCQSALQAGEGVVHQNVTSGHFELEFNHRGATGRDQGGLHVDHRRGAERSQVVNLVEHLADDVEGRSEIGAAHAEEDAHGFAHVGCKAWASLASAMEAPLKTKYSGFSSSNLVVSSVSAPLVPKGWEVYNFALHDIEFTVNGGQTACRLDQDHAIHTIRNVLRDHWCGTVIDEQTGLERFESDHTLTAGLGLGGDRTAAWDL